MSLALNLGSGNFAGLEETGSPGSLPEVKGVWGCLWDLGQR